jgi:hypothetical protein
MGSLCYKCTQDNVFSLVLLDGLNKYKDSLLHNKMHLFKSLLLPVLEAGDFTDLILLDVFVTSVPQMEASSELHYPCCFTSQ